MGTTIPDYSQGGTYKDWYDQQVNAYNQELQARTGNPSASMYDQMTNSQQEFGAGVGYENANMGDWNLFSGKKILPKGPQAIYGPPDESYQTNVDVTGGGNLGSGSGGIM